MLIVVEHRDAAARLERLLDFEAVRGADVFDIDAAKGVGDARHGFNEDRRILGVDLDVEAVDARKALEQQPLALHHRLACKVAEIAEAEDGRAIGDDAHEIALARVVVSRLGRARDLPNRLGDTRAVSEGKIARGCGGLGYLYADLSGARGAVIVERIFREGHGRFRSSG